MRPTAELASLMLNCRALGTGHATQIGPGVEVCGLKLAVSLLIAEVLIENDVAMIQEEPWCKVRFNRPPK